ncbi:hypothetical protein LGT39_14210 [Demequina sp. TTPB684]|uniref:DUF6199 family natural product biosynthesis protein n=1 Tax=unclassified Demequina TaxID=2620311 RepID=UPI001CF47648|nr:MULTISPECIES: DUF6199 family natural product biosynthesis protein [unclassified Demequina]MCB2414001.1 hypothetical protein [Demequina sp. TTPB684]UPU89118.1 hypothetical protein LGT36_004120 [Demequina sp. TMPB413]
MWFVAVVLVAIGIVDAIWPKTGWWLSNWWNVTSDSEPTDFALVAHRLFGAIVVVAAVVWLATAN